MESDQYLNATSSSSLTANSICSKPTSKINSHKTKTFLFVSLQDIEFVLNPKTFSLHWRWSTDRNRSAINFQKSFIIDVTYWVKFSNTKLITKIYYSRLLSSTTLEVLRRYIKQVHFNSIHTSSWGQTRFWEWTINLRNFLEKLVNRLSPLCKIQKIYLKDVFWWVILTEGVRTRERSNRTSPTRRSRPRRHRWRR